MNKPTDNIITHDEILDVTDSVKLAMSELTDSADIFDEDADIQSRQVPGYPNYEYIPFGVEDELPFNIIKMIGKDEIMSQNKLFNVLTCYGAGLKYIDRATGQESDMTKWLAS